MTGIYLLVAACALAQAGEQPKAQKASVLFDGSAKLINAVVERPVERVDPVREMILNADVFGIGKTRGTVTARVVPSDSYALLELVFTGQTQSQTVSYDEPVKAYTKTATNFEVDKTIVITDAGLRGYCARPAARAAVCLDFMTDFCGQVDNNAVDVGRQMFRIAKCDIEIDAGRKAERRLGPRFDQDVQEQIDKANQALTRLRQSLPPLTLKWNSGEDRVGVQIAVEGATPTTPPPALSGKPDAAVRVHQNVLRDAATRGLAGKTMTLLELASKVESILAPVLGGTKEGANVEALARLLKGLGIAVPAFTLAGYQPLTFDFEGDGFTITLHGTSFTSAKTTYPGRYIRATYKLEKSPQGFAAVRQGLPEVRRSFIIPEPEETAEDRDIRSTLETTFGLFFPARLDMNDVTIPLEEGRSIRLVPADARLGNGWLTLAWTLKSV